MSKNKFEGYFNYYISKVKNEELLPFLTSQKDELIEALQRIDSTKHEYRYEDGKWSVKEVIFHIIETEIIMLYRAIRIARGDKTPLPGYDENEMIDKARVESMGFESLLELFKHSRETTLFYFSHFNDSELNSIGEFGGNTLDAESVGYLIAGHAIHHMEVLNERYL